MFVIGDDTPDRILFPNGSSCGLALPRSRIESDAYAYTGIAEPFPANLLIPEQDWQGMIQEQEATKSTIRHLTDQAGLPYKRQARTLYCWINAPVYAVETLRVIQNQEMVILSPASAGAQIKRFRNVGGWGKEGLEWIVEHGVCPVDIWPANAIDRKYLTEEAVEASERYKVTEWWELKPRNMRELVSCLLHRIPVAVGYDWWGHEVTAVGVVWLDGRIALLIRNSWEGWGDNGYGVLQGKRMIPDDAVAPRVVLAA
jgi:hypothetical protein